MRSYDHMVTCGNEIMPKDTFFNLPEDKRTLICDVAIDEFAEYPFDQASINRIVAKSGIAKGSFYQYFEDKKDLFLYVIQLIAEEKINYFSPIMRNPDEHDIFTLIRELFLSGVQFANEHPRYAAIANKHLANKEAPIYKEAKAYGLPLSYPIFETLLENAIARGEVRADIDINMLTHVIASMNVAVVEYHLEFLSQTIDASMIETADKFLDLLKNGMGEKN
jgi:AcrR family transcriptional regulator